MTVIFFDAVGTLFGVRVGVGHLYGVVAKEFGVDLDPTTIDRYFGEVFRDAPPMAFPGTDQAAIPKKEYQWWHTLALETFQRSGDYGKFHDFDSFFRELYQFFASPKAWEVYADVPPTLAKLRSGGYKLGIISNFDSRLFSVLASLELSPFFDRVIISSYAGAAKPDRQIFSHALDQFQVSPPEALHVGDSYREDYTGPIGAGLRAFWLQRPQHTLADLPLNA